MGQPTQGEDAKEEGGRSKGSRGVDKNGVFEKGRAGRKEKTTDDEEGRERKEHVE